MPTKNSILFCALLGVAGCGAYPGDPLSQAAARGDLQEAGRLMAAGVSRRELESALIWAARSGRPEAIDFLVKKGADPNARAGVNEWTVLLHAIHRNQAASVVALVRNGANVNGRMRSGETPLMMAAGYGYTEIVRTLLESGADVYAVMDNGRNALDLAASGVADIDRFTWGKCQQETIRVLRQWGPRLEAKDTTKLQNCR